MKLEIKIIITITVTFFCLFSGCKNEFEPFTELENELSLFSVLDNRLPFQYVRLQRFYHHDDQKRELNNAKVFLSENNGKSYRLTDTSMMNQNYKYYYLPGYKLKRGLTYRISAILDSNTATWSDGYVWNNPLVQGGIYSYTQNEVLYYISYFYFTKNCADYFLFKLFIEYETEQNGKKVKGYSEAPIELRIYDSDYETSYTIYDYEKKAFDLRYTFIEKNGDTTNHVRSFASNPVYYYTWFPGYNIIYALKFLNDKVANSQITVKRALFVFYSIDANIYENFLKAGKEQYSVRLDEPFYWSNVSTPKGSGYGFVGSITADTLSVKIPDELITKFGYKNGQ